MAIIRWLRRFLSKILSLSVIIRFILTRLIVHIFFIVIFQCFQTFQKTISFLCQTIDLRLSPFQLIIDLLLSALNLVQLHLNCKDVLFQVFYFLFELIMTCLESSRFICNFLQFSLAFIELSSIFQGLRHVLLVLPVKPQVLS